MKATDDYDFPFDEKGIQEAVHDYKHAQMALFLRDPVVDRCMGCLFGAFVGDALGSYLEFAKEKDYNFMMAKVMEMPGGGVFKLKPGQITDDSELAFHLLKALANCDPQGNLDAKMDNLLITCAAEYLNWFQSRPFDIGITCRKGLSQVSKLFEERSINRNTSQYSYGPETARRLVQDILERVAVVSSDSQSNGSLMRVSPLPFFFGLISQPIKGDMLNVNLGLSRKGMNSFLRTETALLHPNPTVVEATHLWERMLLGLVKRRSDDEIYHIYEATKKGFESEQIGWGKFLSTNQQVDAKREHIGWSKVALSLGFESLRRIVGQNQLQLSEQTYREHIREVLSRGGDTDTNAAIVGGMLGALIGFKKLPKRYLSKMMELRFESIEQNLKRENRPKEYEPRVAYANAFTIIRRFFPKGKL